MTEEKAQEARLGMTRVSERRLILEMVGIKGGARMTGWRMTDVLLQEDLVGRRMTDVPLQELPEVGPPTLKRCCPR